MACDILDFRCILVSEIAGSVLLAVLIGALIYFVVAGKLKWGFDTTIVMAFPIILILGLSMAGFSSIFAFSTVIAGIMLAWIFNQIIRSN